MAEQTRSATQVDLSEVLSLLRTRRADDALARLAALPEADRDSPTARGALSYAQALRGRVGPARAAAESVLTDPAADLLALDLAGNALTLAQAPDRAHAAFRRAVALAPDSPSLLLNLAASARFVGEMDEAEAAYDRALRLDPAAWDGYRARSEIRRQTPERNHVAQLQGLLASRRAPPEGEVRLLYALGKEYEDLGDHARAFEAFHSGARSRRARMRYDVRADLQTLELIARTFDAAYCAAGRQAEGEPGAIFILGLPRTGSTLLERMLGRHSQVQPLGELQAFGAALTAAVRARPPAPADRPAMIRAAGALPPGEVGGAYLDAVAPLRDDRPAFIDKLPFNSLYAGLIARALPTARVIHTSRDPLDTCWAIYKTLFEEAYPYAYDFGELAAYHNAHAALMAHWRDVLGERFIEVSYETLVTAPEAEMARLMSRLGLAMEPVCLRPDLGEGPVMTASASQVREPLHTRSVNLARRYGARLTPLISALAAASAAEVGRLG